MKRIIATLMILISAVSSALAQESLFDAFVSKASDSVLYVSYHYSTVISGVKAIGDGTFSIQGTSYRHSSLGLDMWCDGETIWTADSAAKEMVIESVMMASSPFAANPTMVLVSPDSSFEVKNEIKKGELTEYQLIPKVDCGVKNCTLSFSGNTSNPIIKKAVLILDDGTRFVMTFSDMKFSSDFKDASYYRPGELGPSWVITDLR